MLMFLMSVIGPISHERTLENLECDHFPVPKTHDCSVINRSFLIHCDVICYSRSNLKLFQRSKKVDTNLCFNLNEVEFFIKF